jgi:hypothetical protein
MHRKYNARSSLFTSTSSKPVVRELKQISRILDETPRLLDPVVSLLTINRRERVSFSYAVL